MGSLESVDSIGIWRMQDGQMHHRHEWTAPSIPPSLGDYPPFRPDSVEFGRTLARLEEVTLRSDQSQSARGRDRRRRAVPNRRVQLLGRADGDRRSCCRDSSRSRPIETGTSSLRPTARRCGPPPASSPRPSPATRCRLGSSTKRSTTRSRDWPIGGRSARRWTPRCAHVRRTSRAVLRCCSSISIVST